VFLDNVVTSTLVFEGEGRIGEYVGGYEDWQRYQQQVKRRTPPAVKKGTQSKTPVSLPKAQNVKRKLSYKEQCELELLPEKIEQLERKQQQLQQQINDAAFYRQDGEHIAATLAQLEQVSFELEQTYARWEALE